MRDISMVRTEASLRSGAPVMVLSQREKPLFEWSAPPTRFAEARHVEGTDRGVLRVGRLDHGLVPAVDAAVRVERAAALILPGADHGRNAGHGMHVLGTVAMPGKPIAK